MQKLILSFSFIRKIAKKGNCNVGQSSSVIIVDVVKNVGPIIA